MYLYIESERDRERENNIHICVYVYVCSVCVYIYIYRERERVIYVHYAHEQSYTWQVSHTGHPSLASFGLSPRSLLILLLTKGSLKSRFT